MRDGFTQPIVASWNQLQDMIETAHGVSPPPHPLPPPFTLALLKILTFDPHLCPHPYTHPHLSANPQNGYFCAILGMITVEIRHPFVRWSILSAGPNCHLEPTQGQASIVDCPGLQGVRLTRSSTGQSSILICMLDIGP